MKAELTCIICPNGCRLAIERSEDGTIKVENAMCGRGKDYAVNELTNPVRTLTTTVKVEGGVQPLVSVRTDRPIPRKMLLEAARALRGVSVCAPVHAGQKVAEDLLGTGANVIATADA